MAPIDHSEGDALEGVLYHFGGRVALQDVDEAKEEVDAPPLPVLRFDRSTSGGAGGSRGGLD